MRIVFQFEGGFLDGKTIVGDTDAQEPGDPARRYLFLTHGGRVGARFRDNPFEVPQKTGPMDMPTQMAKRRARFQAFIDNLRSLGLDFEWVCAWQKKTAEGDVLPSRDEIRQALVVHLSSREAQVASEEESIDQVVEELFRQFKKYLKYLESQKTYHYEVVARETIEDETRVRVALVA